MQIKEVEQLTGLTAKAIRLYESKGLLRVARQSENDYRDYTQEDVQRLKTIALLRKLDVPVKIIKEWTDGEITLQEILRKASDQSQQETKESELRHRLSSDLAELLEADPELDVCAVVGDLEELQSLLQELEEAIREDNRHIMMPIWQTVIALGPILSTVIYILEGRAERALIGFAASLLLVPWCVKTWADYLNVPKQERKHSGCMSVLVMAIVTLAAMFGLVLGLQDMQNALFLKSETDILLVRKPWDTLFIGFEIVIIGLLLLLWKKPWRGRSWKPKWVAAAAAGLLMGCGVLFYGCLTGVSVASEEGIMRYSFFCPKGEFAPYTEIRGVDAGFRGKTLGLAVNHTGDFYYTVTYADGTVEDWGDSTCQDEVTWSWMIRLDEWMLSCGAEKTGSDENWEYCEMDEMYVEILRRVINNR